MTDAFLRRMYRILFPERAKNYLGLYGHLFEDGANPMILEDFSADKIVVLSPHFDDDAIGCGGTIRLFKKQGSRVTVIYITDGRKGNPAMDRMTLSEEERKEKEDALVIRRKGEAKKCAERLEIDRIVFLDLPDMMFNCTPSTVERMQRILDEGIS